MRVLRDQLRRYGITMVSICAYTWAGRPLLTIVEAHAFHRATVFDESPGTIPEPETRLHRRGYRFAVKNMRVCAKTSLG